MERPMITSLRLSLAAAAAVLTLGAVPAAATVYWACPDGTYVTDSRDCAKHGVLALSVKPVRVGPCVFEGTDRKPPMCALAKGQDRLCGAKGGTVVVLGGASHCQTSGPKLPVVK